MPRLPSVDTLGQSAPQTTAMSGSYRVREVINPLSGLGDAGEILLKRAQVEKDKADREAAALAEEREKSKYLNAVANIDAAIDWTQAEIDKDPTKYMEAEGFARKSIDPKVAELASGLNAKYKMRFQAAVVPKLSQMYSKQRTYAVTQGRAYALSDSEDRLMTTQTALANTSDPVEREILITKAFDEYEHQKGLGKDPKAIGEERRKFVKTSGENRIKGASLHELRQMRSRFKTSEPAKPEQVIAFRDAHIAHVMDKYENAPEMIVDTVDKDGNPTSYQKLGINFEKNKKELAAIGIKTLEDFRDKFTREQAEKIYISKYWNGSGADKASPEMALMLYDTAVNQGVGAAKRIAKLADGDVEKFARLRKQRYRRTAKEYPELAENLEGWEARVDQVLMDAGGLASNLYKDGLGSYEPGGDELDFIPQGELRDKLDAEIEAKEGAALVEIDEVTDETSNAIIDNPDAFYQSLEDLDDLIASYGLTPEKAEKKRTEMEASLSQSYIQALINKDDVRAEAELRSGELDEYLTPAQKRQALKDIVTSRNAEKVEADKIRTERRYAAENRLLDAILLGEPNEDGTELRHIPFKEAQLRILADPDLRAGEKQGLLRILDDREKGTANETNWNLFAVLQDRIDDPNDKIGLPEIRQHLGAGLAYTQMKELENRYQNPVDEEVKRAEIYIKNSIYVENIMGADPKKAQVAMMAQAEMRNQIQELREKGKTRAEINKMLDPTNGDNILNPIIENYRRTPDVILKEKLEEARSFSMGDKKKPLKPLSQRMIDGRQ